MNDLVHELVSNRYKIYWFNILNGTLLAKSEYRECTEKETKEFDALAISAVCGCLYIKHFSTPFTVQYITSLSNVYYKYGNAHMCMFSMSPARCFALLCFDIDAVFGEWVRACVAYWIAVSVYTKQPNDVNAQQQNQRSIVHVLNEYTEVSRRSRSSVLRAHTHII